MLRRRILTALVALFLLAAFFTTEARAWYCEGRQCGITFGGCCCSLPPLSQDPRCSTASPVGSARADTSLCASACECVMVSITAGAADKAPASVQTPPVPDLVLLLPTRFCLAAEPALREMAPQNPKTRGPPAQTLAPAGPSLRAPPAAA